MAGFVLPAAVAHATKSCGFVSQAQKYATQMHLSLPNRSSSRRYNETRIQRDIAKSVSVNEEPATVAAAQEAKSLQALRESEVYSTTSKSPSIMQKVLEVMDVHKIKETQIKEARRTQMEKSHKIAMAAAVHGDTSKLAVMDVYSV